MNSQRAHCITTTAQSTSINPTPNPFSSSQGVVYTRAQLQLRASLSFNLSLPLSSFFHSLTLVLKASRTLYCCVV